MLLYSGDLQILLFRFVYILNNLYTAIALLKEKCVLNTNYLLITKSHVFLLK